VAVPASPADASAGVVQCNLAMLGNVCAKVRFVTHEPLSQFVPLAVLGQLIRNGCCSASLLIDK
jgi:hypothetical protein